MEDASGMPVCYEVGAVSVRLTACGIREPIEPFPQPKRVLDDFVAFLVVRGEIHLNDFLPTGEDPVTVHPGEIHIVPPGLYQSSIVPFARGIKFLWLHFSFDGGYHLRSSEAAAGIVRQLFKPRDKVAPQSRWLIPRHLTLLSDFEPLTRMHSELLDNAKLWGTNDPGTQHIGAHMVYTLHRAFVQETLRSTSIGRAAPELAHVGRARNFIRLNYERDISLSEVADAVALNPSYLSRCFRRVTGETIVDYILKTRIEAAKVLLAENPQAPSIKEVAFATGFKSPAYFCRIFRRHEKQTAMQYVERNS